MIQTYNFFKKHLGNGFSKKCITKTMPRIKTGRYLDEGA